MTEMTIEQQVEQDYKASMDSVALINSSKPDYMDDEQWADTIQRNKDHLQLQLDKADYYAGYDLTPFEEAVK